MVKMIPAMALLVLRAASAWDETTVVTADRLFDVPAAGWIFLARKLGVHPSWLLAAAALDRGQ